MRLIKALGLAVPVVAAVIVFVNPSPSSTRADEKEDAEVVLCEVGSTELCPGNKIWGPGKFVIGESSELHFLGPWGSEGCEKVRFGAHFFPKMAATLEWNANSGVITECTKPCATITFAEPPKNKITMDPVEVYLILMKFKVKLQCEGGYECVFSADNTFEFGDTNTHGYPKVIATKAPLSLVTGSKTLCGTTSTWDGMILLNGVRLTVLFSLYELTPLQKEEQVGQEAHEKELHEKEWHEEELEFEKEL
jgi:hypothetical protein